MDVCSIFSFVDGPIMDPNMTLSVLSSRDADPNIEFSLSFNVSFGPPSGLQCLYNGNNNLFGLNTNVTYQIIRPRYISSSEPDMTRIIIRISNQSREERTYTCNVWVEGRAGIQSNPYHFDPKGTGSLTTTVTGECIFGQVHHYVCASVLSCRHPHWCHCQ